MVPSGVKERLAHYKKWLKALLMGEFLDLPHRQQEQFITMMDIFLKDCRKIHEESERVLERSVTLQVNCITEDDEWAYFVGTAENVIGEIRIRYPQHSAPRDEKKIVHMVYSLDGQDWYSSKSLLIRGTVCSEK